MHVHSSPKRKRSPPSNVSHSSPSNAFPTSSKTRTSPARVRPNTATATDTDTDTVPPTSLITTATTTTTTTTITCSPTKATTHTTTTQTLKGLEPWLKSNAVASSSAMVDSPARTTISFSRTFPDSLPRVGSESKTSLIAINSNSHSNSNDDGPSSPGSGPSNFIRPVSFGPLSASHPLSPPLSSETTADALNHPQSYPPGGLFSRTKLDFAAASPPAPPPSLKSSSLYHERPAVNSKTPTTTVKQYSPPQPLAPSSRTPSSNATPVAKYSRPLPDSSAFDLFTSTPRQCPPTPQRTPRMSP
eukprot:CAMPEP_0197551248 /NCGR_PEP_ID=MMETSP1320-20131121/4578_1 /TAXON_ID=91990 /ORGANISM="Bolidomonas sp., Strain RCC2347" /LENGTH=301 /DNA_ID=CAMNT_0043111709 /DNA_START=305 /DNA_END=1207 /DNA_ORIENTATION=-